MFKILLMTLITSITLTGCSILPRFTFDTPNTLPQQVEKSKSQEKCQGETKFNARGEIVYCAKGYYRYAENYEKKERKMTIAEKMKSWINGLAGWGLIILVALLVLCPSALGFIAGRIIEGVFGTAATVGKRLIVAIQKVRKEGKDLNQSLESELDQKDKQYIRNIKDKINL